MKLSIYVNLRSIGWIITDGKEVIGKGIKRVMVEFDNYYEFIAGLPISKRIRRRGKRTMRRNLWRYKSRRENLKKYLTKLGMIQDKEYSLKEILELRVKAISEKVNNSELAAIFLSLQKKRGYKNMRGLSNADSSDYLAEIKKHKESLKEYRSVAEYLLLNFESTKNIIFPRESYENEFNDICKKQEINDKRLFNLIYFQRSLSRGKIAYCTLEKNRKVCHYSHPDYQYFRILRDVNNISISDYNFEEIEISQEIRDKWVDKLISGQNLTKAQCCKDLGIKKSTGYSWKSGKQIQGCIISQHFKNLNDRTCYFELWQDLFSSTDELNLRKLLEKKYPNENIDELLDIDFNSAGWGEYSHKAIMKLIPLLINGKKLKEAILDLYGIVDFSDKLSLRNLIVEQHFDSYSSLVDALKEKYPITETAIEISHLLKAGNKIRRDIARNQRKEAKRDKSYTDYQYALLSLYEEFKGYSPYEPEKEISKDELFENYNIDHIVPKSKLFEHGKVNQCLCRKDLNELKSSLTGIEFAKYLGIEEKYRQWVDNSQLSEQKKRYLLMVTDKIPENHINSDDYITRCFATKADYVIPNRIINKYYKDWNLNKYQDNDIRNSLMKAFVIANFNTQSIDYFNNLKNLPNQSMGRYNIKPEIPFALLNENNVIPYLPRIKYYRKTKYGKIPRFQLHDDSVFGKRKEIYRNTKGEITENYYFKVRKPVASLTAPMIGKIMDVGLKRKFKAFFADKEHTEAIIEYLENPILHNGKPIKSVSIRVNAKDLIKLERGYVYSSMNHRLNLNTFKPITLHQYISDVNNGINYTGQCLQRNDIIEYEGRYYFIVGANSPENIILRSVYELDAKGIRCNKKILQNAKIVRVNQTGELRYESSTHP